ncbi:family 20 glycosylhydrolase [Pinibacter soli]|uniref:beta-N-acetylhexosaminidase n=1 Tax=Pinibacter soli TaxID=3044211 RepID=A0ABT6R9K8_9BACT|nr:family 20 glycosylhydrolase [Pinibacter soli]MDI3319248.1 family 20 glycosylhydrolase [Pinibacter soli]
MNRFIRKGFKSFLYLQTLIFFCLGMHAQTTQRSYNIIPQPAQLKAQPGNFVISNKTVLVSPTDNSFYNETGFLRNLIQNYIGVNALKFQKSATANAIVLKYDASLKQAEAYSLTITPKTITLAAKDGAGMFYAIETLRQLLPAAVEGGKGNTLSVPCLQIADQPAFGWRGMMLDVSRHFFSIQYLKKYADMMALYKLNKLHLHLTDDQGWRIEIKKYPSLTSEGAWRTFDNHDSACIAKAEATGNDDWRPEAQHTVQRNGQTLYGGFYTQDEMREFIRYAASRHIEVIPEIDMPGHMMAAARIYPELTCDTVIVSNKYDFSNPICPCNPRVLEFAKDIFTEIADLFPSTYIHIGGDEVNKKYWERSPVVKAFMRQKGFSNITQIQSYFNDYMLAFFKTKGKTMIGWDEIIEGKIDSSAVVMFWRTWAPKAPLEAVKNGNKLVMTPDGPYYFDAIEDAQTLPSVYNYDPSDAGKYHMSDQEKKSILGVQANLWTENIASEKRADYMIMPRLTALSEVGWTHRYSYKDYLQRLSVQYERLDKLNVNYRLPDINNLVSNYVVMGKTPFFAASPVSRFKVHYTLDGSAPVAASPIMERPVTLEHSAVMKLALFTPSGRRGDVYTLNFSEQQLAQNKSIPNLKSGLAAEYYKGAFAVTTAIKGTPDSVFVTDGIKVPESIKAPAFGLKYKGYIEVPETGIYTFYLMCNDGGVLIIDDKKIIDNDGLHPDKTIGGQVALQKGLHSLAVDFSEYGGGYSLELKYSYKGGEPKVVPAAWFKKN